MNQLKCLSEIHKIKSKIKMYWKLIINFQYISLSEFDFSDTKISINYLDDIYIIIGTNLVISKMMEEELLITGNIESISFNK